MSLSHIQGDGILGHDGWLHNVIDLDFGEVLAGSSTSVKVDFHQLAHHSPTKPRALVV